MVTVAIFGALFGIRGATANDYDIPEAIKEAKKHFSFVKLVKPKASRLKSAEIYLLGMNFQK